MYFCYFVIFSPRKKAGPFIWTNLNLLHPKMHYANFGWNWSSGFGEDDFYISSMYFRYFVIISPWKKVRLSSEPTWVLITQECVVLRLVEIGPVALERNIFKFRQCNFVIIPHWKKLGHFIWKKNNLNPLHSNMQCAMFGWNWPSDSGEEHFFLFNQCVFDIYII